MSIKSVLAGIENCLTVNWKPAVLVLGHECEERFVDIERAHVEDVEGLRAMNERLEVRVNERIFEMGRLYDAELEVLAKALELRRLSATDVGSLGN